MMYRWNTVYHYRSKLMFKTFDIEIKELDDEKRQMTVVGSKQMNDRDNDIIDVKGMDLKNYKKNPVFIWAHRGSETPENVMGHAKKVWIDGKNLMFKLEFLDMEINPRADMVFKMFKAKALRAFSIGFAPDWETASYNEKRNGFDFPTSELLEISAVPVPANPAALANELKQVQMTGNADELEVKDFELYLKDNFEEVEIKEPLEKKVLVLESKIEALEKKIDAKLEVEVKEPEVLHIVDQVFTDIFESSDDKSIDDPEKNTKEDDDSNSLLDEILGE